MLRSTNVICIYVCNNYAICAVLFCQTMFLTKHQLINLFLRDKMKSSKHISLEKTIKYFCSHQLCIMRPSEASFMCECVAKMEPGQQSLEIGRKYGGSMILMCLANRRIKVYSLDINEDWRDLVKKIAKSYGVRRKQFKMLTGDSRNHVWDRGPLHFILLDGWCIESDLSRYPQLLENGGVLMISGYHPWKKHVEKFAAEHPEFQFLKRVKNNIAFKKAA